MKILTEVFVTSDGQKFLKEEDYNLYRKGLIVQKAREKFLSIIVSKMLNKYSKEKLTAVVDKDICKIFVGPKDDLTEVLFSLTEYISENDFNTVKKYSFIKYGYNLTVHPDYFN